MSPKNGMGEEAFGRLQKQIMGYIELEKFGGVVTGKAAKKQEIDGLQLKADAVITDIDVWSGIEPVPDPAGGIVVEPEEP